MNTAGISDINKAYYDRLYAHSSPLAFKLHRFCSFDQKLKARPNLRVLSQYFDKISTPGRDAGLLDYGFGWGSLLSMIPGNISLYGYELSQEATRIVGKTFGRRSFKIVSINNGRIEPGGFDFAVCSHVLEHCEDDLRVIAMLVESLKPGGILLINVPINEFVTDPHHCRKYSPEDLQRKAEAAGLSTLSLIQTGRCDRILYSDNRDYPAKTLIRAIRFVMAVMPYWFTTLIEDMFIKSETCYQCIYTGRKAESVSR
jgi:2-polyprenyl-3-methyl-5-hydroxy-6-metoxy-1,4-benzoquinol methylase